MVFQAHGTPYERPKIDSSLCSASLSPDSSERWRSRFLSLFGQPTRTVEVGSTKQDAAIAYEVHGIPSHAQFRKVGANEIFRHYSPTANLKTIRESHVLTAGILPYIQSGGSRTTFVDITGIFFTKPEYSPRAAGVSSELQNSYVDFRLPEGTVILELEPQILLLPGPPSLPSWLKPYISAFKNGSGDIPHYLLPTLQRIRDKNLFNEQPLQVKIEIVGSRNNGIEFLRSTPNL
jgi:hypothetical protein